MKGKYLVCVFSGSLALILSMAVVSPAFANGEWQAPDVTLFLGPDVVDDGQTDKAGPMLNETIPNYWDDGACTYDPVTQEPSSDCDRLRFGLAMYRGPDPDLNNNPGYCPDPFASLVPPQEDGGGLLTLDGNPYKLAQLQTDAGTSYCSDPGQRTTGDSMLAYRDHRFGTELGTNWPERPQLTLQLIEKMPQTNDSTPDQVRKSLLAACNLFEGNGNQHLAMPTWVMLSPLVTDAAALFGGMLAAAGGTGQCCRTSVLGGTCDPTDPAEALDMCAYLRQTANGVPVVGEALLRTEIANERYICSGTGKPAGPGAMSNKNFSDMKCHLNGSPCDTTRVPNPAYLWPVFSCIQLRPSNIPPDQLSVEYCGKIDGVPIDASHGDKDGDGCITLTPGNGIEWVDQDKNLYYFSQGNADMCRGLGSEDSYTTVNCPNLNELCELEDGSQCSLGRYQCVNEQQVCERFPGNDSCDSAACGAEQIHETGIVQPNVQFVVDRSASMWGDRWSSARTVSGNIAHWSYDSGACEADGTNCDKVRLGVHFWDDAAWPIHAADEEMNRSKMENAYGINPRGGTDFHHAAQLLADEPALQDPSRPNVGIFLTDGIPESAFTTREAARIFCDLKTRPDYPVGTYAVGYQDGNQLLNSMMAAAGGTGSCCFSGDGTCDTERETSPCEMYQWEKDNGQRVVDEFEAWLSANNSSALSEWQDLNADIEAASRTGSAYRNGNVADDLDMVDDVARFLYEQEGGDVDAIDCDTDAGDANAGGSNPRAFYRYIICEMQNSLSYVIRHRYGGETAEQVDSWSEFDDVYATNHDSTFADGNYVCTGAKQANDEDALYAEFQAILSGMECTYPLSLLDGMQSAPEYTGATRVKLYLPSLGKVVEVPYTGDTTAQSDFRDTLCTLGIENCDNYADDGWSFSNQGRTSVSLSSELCELTKTDTVEKVTTQVCRMCDLSLVGSSCDYVPCSPASPPANPTVGQTVYTAGGEMCAWSEFPCPETPDNTCSGWTKTGRCGMGSYACDEDGFPYCEQSRSAMPEICNNVDDDCDGAIDDMSENLEDWNEPKYSIAGEDYDGWYCGYRDTCKCPEGHTDSIGGTKADGEDEFTKMMQHQEEFGECTCGEGLSEGGYTAYAPTRTWAPDKPAGEPQAACSASGDRAPTGLGAALFALLLGVAGWRRRRA